MLMFTEKLRRVFVWPNKHRKSGARTYKENHRGTNKKTVIARPGRHHNGDSWLTTCLTVLISCIKLIAGHNFQRQASKSWF